MQVAGSLVRMEIIQSGALESLLGKEVNGNIASTFNALPGGHYYNVKN
jgi:hypothetical protein